MPAVRNEVDEARQLGRDLDVVHQEPHEEGLDTARGIEVCGLLRDEVRHRVGIQNQGGDAGPPTTDDSVDERHVDVRGAGPGGLALTLLAVAPLDVVQLFLGPGGIGVVDVFDLLHELRDLGTELRGLVLEHGDGNGILSIRWHD